MPEKESKVILTILFLCLMAAIYLPDIPHVKMPMMSCQKEEEPYILPGLNSGFPIYDGMYLH